MPKEKQYFSSAFIEKGVTKLPGYEKIRQCLSDEEKKLERKLPKTFPISLWMLSFMANEKKTRQEIILPGDPKEPIYWLGFSPGTSYKLKDSLLGRITDRPQVFQGLVGHSNINDIIAGLRAVYDGIDLERVKKNLLVPGRDFAGHASFTGDPYQVTFHIIRANKKIDIAKDFENVLKKYSATDMLLKKGYNEIYNAVEDELICIDTLL